MRAVTPTRIDPKSVLDSLSRHMLVDGYHVVMDMKRSRGNFIYDALHDVSILDFYSHFATCPIGYAHPKTQTPEFLEELGRAAVTKPANSDIYTEEMAEFVDTFATLAVPATHNRHLFFVEGGALANENQLKAAFDWKVRRNFRKGWRREVGTKILHFEQAFHGRSGYTLSLTNTSDPRGRRCTSRSSTGRASSTRSSRSRSRRRAWRRRRASRSSRSGRSKAPSSRIATTSRPSSSSPFRAKAATTTSGRSS